MPYYPITYTDVRTLVSDAVNLLIDLWHTHLACQPSYVHVQETAQRDWRIRNRLDKYLTASLAVPVKAEQSLGAAKDMSLVVGLGTLLVPFGCSGVGLARSGISSPSRYARLSSRASSRKGNRTFRQLEPRAYFARAYVLAAPKGLEWRGRVGAALGASWGNMEIRRPLVGL